MEIFHPNRLISSFNHSHLVNLIVKLFALIRSNTLATRSLSSLILFAPIAKSSKYCANHPVVYRSPNIFCIAAPNTDGAPFGPNGITVGINLPIPDTANANSS